MASVRTALAGYLGSPESSELWSQFQATRREAAGALARLPRRETAAPVVQEALRLVREISGSGAQDRPVEAEDLVRAAAFARKGAPGLVAAMLLVPGWQWADAPLFLEVADWLRPDFVAWIFSPPLGFCCDGQAEQFAEHCRRRMEELERWIDRRPGAAAEAAALEAFSRTHSSMAMCVGKGDLCQVAQLRGRLLSRTRVRGAGHAAPGPSPRLGRRLRLGLLAPSFGADADSESLLPLFEHLDQERFEVLLYSRQAGTGHGWEHCRSRAAALMVLPEDPAGQVGLLRAAELDVVVFGADLTSGGGGLAKLAVHRIAPLQIIDGRSPFSSGLPEIDLYLSGTVAATDQAGAQLSERLGLLPGPGRFFGQVAGAEQAGIRCARAAFGLPEDALVMASIASALEMTPELRRIWVQLLKGLPEARLLIHPGEENRAAERAVGRLRAEFSPVLAAEGVDPARVAFSTMRLASRTDARTLLGLGDIYLAPYPLARADAVVAALEAGRPVVAWEGETLRSRTAGALLRSLGLSELVAADAASYQAITMGLAAQPAHRLALSARIQGLIARTPIFLDALAASEAFGDLIETAYDELLEVGAEVFRANPEPLRAARLGCEPPRISKVSTEEEARAALRAAPADPVARRCVGRALLAAGRPGRGVTYLLAALQGAEDDAGLWLEIATAFRADGQAHQAIQALEASLRIDEAQAEGWQLLSELAREVGATDLASEAAAMAKTARTAGQGR